MAEQHQILHQTMKRLLQARLRKPGTLVPTTQQTLILISTIATETFLNGSVPNILRLEPPIHVVGDIHGQFYDLLRIFDQLGLPPTQKYLFLGDYVDRGPQSIETISLLLVLKILYPEHVFLLRGNHESPEVNSTGGFKSECDSRYSTRLWTVFNEVFSSMPLSAIIGDKIFACHAGIGPGVTLEAIQNVPRPLLHPEGILIDILWADPEPLATDYQPNPRGCSVLYGPDQVQQFLDQYSFDILIRSHQSAAGGFEFPFDPDRSVTTVFSAPYAGPEGQNPGAIMTINESLCCNFTTISPLERKAGANNVTPLEAILKAGEPKTKSPSSSLSRSLPLKNYKRPA